MQILVDLERLCILYKHPNQAALMSLANIEVPESAVVVMSATDPDSYERFTDYELKVMFNNICGMAHDGFHRSDLIQSVRRLVGMLPETQLNPAEVEAQLLTIKEPEQGGYRYVFGSQVPAAQQDLFTPAALVTVPGHKPKDKKYFVRNPKHEVIKCSEPPKGNPLLPEAHVPTPRTSSTEPREPSGPPKAGSKTGRVWEICNACYAQHPHLDKQLRKLVADACEKEGINSSTMSVQHSKWKLSKAS